MRMRPPWPGQDPGQGTGILRDLDRFQEVEVEQDAKRFIRRTPTTGTAGKLFQTLRVALPPNLRDAAFEPAEPALL